MRLPKKKHIVLGSIAAAFLLASLLLFLLGAGSGKHLLAQRQAERWTGESEERYTQFSAFFGPETGLGLDGVGALRQQITENLTKASIELPAGGEYFCDAWSGSGSVKVSSGRGSYDAQVLAVGGHFFEFHPQELFSGVLLQENDLLIDRVVIDEQLAWLLYGSTELAGMTVEIGGQEFYIAGVIAREDDRFTKKLADDTPLLYMPFETYRTMDEGCTADCYEIVLPDPAKGFAKALMEECLPKEGCFLRQNTGRFGFSAAMKSLKSFSTRAVRTEAVAFPLWENAALIAEARGTLCFVLALLMLAYPLVLAGICLVKLVIYAKWRLHGTGKILREKALDRIDEHRIRRMERQQKGKG